MSLPARIGRYEVLELVGRGGMGVLYRGRDAVLDRDVAIKMMSTEYVEDEERRARFYREARAAAKLQHRNIITVFEFGEHDGHPYMVMEFLRGMDLQRRMKTPPPIPIDQKLDFAIGLLSGLGFAHQNGVVHRDVKPANVWVLEDNSVKLLDFGIAKLVTSMSTRHAGVMGTVAYMSPEQVSGRPLDGRSDVFSAAVVLYEVLSGRKPFDGQTVTEVMVGIIERVPPPIPDLPASLVTVLDLAMQKNPDNRYQTAFEFAADLQALRASLRPDSGPQLYLVPPSTTGTNPTMAGALGATLGGAGLQTYLPSSGAMTGTPVSDAAIRPPTATQVPTVVPAPRSRMPLLLGVAVAVVGLAVAGWLVAPQLGLRQSGPASPVTPVEPATPRASMLQIVTTPPGARVSVNGVDAPEPTPTRVELSGTPPYKVGLSLEGFQSKSIDLTQSDVASGQLSWQFEAARVEVTLRVSASYPFELYRQGTRVSPAADRHAIKVQAPDTLQARSADVFLDQTIRVQPSKTGSVTVTLPPLGQLSVRAAPAVETCEILFDGRSVGLPPILGQELTAGSHTITLRCPDGQGPRYTTTIPAGGNVVISCQASGCQPR